ncbi:hypothetical protein [Streptomyces orinoci]|uniref:Uncharacterized protein n=1 Tax=Streptomyces orinoci TaxID=67339 RepID=A0ABV3K6J5_STRON|nr:hypothetical protein [Streptomyces orinoci]
MNWTRTAVAVAGAGALLLTGGGPAVAAAGGGVHVLLNGAFDNRPGELIDIDVQGARGEVTVSSPVFPHPVRLAPYTDRDSGARAHHGRPAVGMGVRPGSYPLTVRASGRVVAQDRVEVRESRRPTFQVTTPDDVIRPGEQFGVWFDDLYPGERGTSFTVSSPVFAHPVRLAHDPRGSHWNNPRMFSGLVTLPRNAKDGTYKVTLTGPGGRRIAEKPLEVGSAEPGDSDYLGRPRGPEFFPSAGHPDAARARRTVGAGGTVNVLWRDASPDPGEEEQLTATSPAFEHPVRLRRDDSKAGDGDDPRFYGPAHIRKGLGQGSYPVTVVSHHGRVRRTEHLIVTAASAGGAASGTAILLAGAGVGTAAAAALGGASLWRRRRAL